ncbi:MAG: 5-bromo-4-chloroindolyl phosphate hydrolysis family protein [Clostridia bacterium]|nr:5-bromo-4-chloroindolyl phosphate hydrolysis family protein [Clostridia bacterium]
MKEDKKEEQPQAPIGKKYVEVPVKSALPFWWAAAVWIIAALFFDLYAVHQIIITAAVSFLVGFIVSKIVPKETKLVKVPVATGNADADTAIKELDRVIAAIDEDRQNAVGKEPETALKMGRIIVSAEKIRDSLLNSPEDVSKLRRFLNYYLPTTVKLTNKYSKLLAGEPGGENYAETKQAIERALGTVGKTFDAQYDSLFAADALDITSDVTVLETMLKKDGLG